MICSSSSVKIPLCRGNDMTESSVGSDLMRHSGGIVASRLDFFCAVASFQSILTTRTADIETNVETMS